MRIAQFVPIAFICGIHGFAMFAPYVAFMLATLHVARRINRRPALVLVRA